MDAKPPAGQEPLQAITGAGGGLGSGGRGGGGLGGGGNGGGGLGGGHTNAAVMTMLYTHVDVSDALVIASDDPHVMVIVVRLYVLDALHQVLQNRIES